MGFDPWLRVYMSEAALATQKGLMCLIKCIELSEGHLHRRQCTSVQVNVNCLFPLR